MNGELPEVFGRKVFVYRRPLGLVRPDRARVEKRVVNMASLTILQWLQLFHKIIEHEFETEGFKVVLGEETFYIYWRDETKETD